MTDASVRFASDVPSLARARVGAQGLLVACAAAAVLGYARLAAAQVPIDVLHTFAITSDPLSPHAGLIQASDGNFYGTTESGGADGVGSIFRMAPDGAVTTLHSFTADVDGEFPSVASLVQANDGNLYGTVSAGGPLGGGTVFRITLTGEFTVMHAFGGSGPRRPLASLIQATDGYLYGTTAQEGPDSYNGTIFKMTLDGALTNLLAFRYILDEDGIHGCGGRMPGPLVEAADGNFYGTTLYGGRVNQGTAFRMTPWGICTELHDFEGEPIDGRYPVGLIQAADGDFYGTTSGGYAGSAGFNNGTIFKMTSDGSVTLLHPFGSSPGEGLTPDAPLIQAADGNFYGTTRTGGGVPNASGTVFKMTPAGGFTVLHSFNGADGKWPTALVQAADGTIYGTTVEGGTADLGTVFAVTLSGSVSSRLHVFTAGLDPAGPYTLMQAADGYFYGTAGGGMFSKGTTFRMTAGGVVTLLHTFTGDADGASPWGLIQGSDGNFYGTTYGGGDFGHGTVFRMTPNGVVTLLHSFSGGTEGAEPADALIQASDGKFYGTTRNGGAADLGTVFGMTLDGTVTTLHAFTGGTDGAHPYAALLQGSNGLFYGSTFKGSTVFRMTADGTVTTLHVFTGTEPRGPGAPLIQATDGNFYGTTGCGGGGIFRMTPAGTVTILQEFNGSFCTNDATPWYPAPTTLVQAADGRLYGSVQSSMNDSSSLLMITPTGNMVVLHTFTSDEGEARGDLVRGSDGNLYGVTRNLAFRFTPRPAPKTVRVAGAAGPVRLSWSATFGATGYTIRRATSSGAETVLAAGVTATTFLDADVVRGQRYYYSVTAVNAFGESVASYEVAITAGRATLDDFDGDTRSNVTVFRPSTGMWYVRDSVSGAATSVLWGDASDIPTPGDYDGDGRADIAVFRPSNGTWYLRPSATGILKSVVWGGDGDVPVPADYDGDGVDDVAVFRRSTGTWYVRQSTTGGLTSVPWGGGDDVPVPGDYDGDGKTDVAVFRPSTGRWHIRNWNTGLDDGVPFGVAGDVPVPGDYDGDGKTDIVVFRPSTGAWCAWNPSTGMETTVVWGGGSDVPVPGDYDGDGLIDIAVFRPENGTWYIRNATSSVVWGVAGDIPLPKQP